METIEGFVEHIIFQNPENGYTVLELAVDDDVLTCVGTLPLITEGETIEAEGKEKEHALYGRQFQIQSYIVKEPEDQISMERYLASGAVKGIGAALAARIIKRFKSDTFRIMEEEPERLAEIKGISLKMARSFAEQMEEKRDLRKAMVFLQKYGISTSLSLKIYEKYGYSLYKIIEENPYQLTNEIQGVGFKTADEIAQKAGILMDSDFRVQSGISYCLSQASQDGHTYLPMEELYQRSAEVLSCTREKFLKNLMDLQIERNVVVQTEQDVEAVYGARYFYLEQHTAYLLNRLNDRYLVNQNVFSSLLNEIEQEIEIVLDQKQREAVLAAVENNLVIVTGAPGTGKTTIINAIIRYFEAEGMELLLAAPTGRAAKRMSEATGCEAKTIHRLLEVCPGIEHQGQNVFGRDEENLLEADVLIIDEMSMVDIFLMHSLLKAVAVGTRLVLVGDKNQLPSVGPGSVLKDMISSGMFRVVELTQIFRQASGSEIVQNAHRLNRGERLPLEIKKPDFFIMRRYDIAGVLSMLKDMILEILPKNIHVNPYEIQVLTPMRKGSLGVEELNRNLQQFLNPPSGEKPERVHGDFCFRIHDKVMQIKNNYQMEWKVKSSHGVTIEEGIGVFNGDVGIISQINSYSESLTVAFDDGREAEYPFHQLDELELAYAVTIHKSQGSEYPAVILPLLSGPKMLLNKNILYTAITRAKKCVTLIGNEAVFYEMSQNESEQKRYSGLQNRLKELRQEGDRIRNS